METPIVTALIAFGGVITGLFGRDIVMALYFARKKREETIAEQARQEARTRLDSVTSYSDPLYEAGRALWFRLDEIIESRNPGYLLAETPSTTFSDYKRLSTAYRLAALLGWIRAFRRDRSYLDPAARGEEAPIAAAILAVETALADGQSVEDQRLSALLKLWSVPADRVSPADRVRLATAIEAARHRKMGDKKAWGGGSAIDHELVKECAQLVQSATSADLPDATVRGRAEEAMFYLQIREAYIYRDWQAAIGDFMIVEAEKGPRRFDVRGYGSFEDLYLEAHSPGCVAARRRWFDRLDALFYDLDMSKTGVFDARREQIRRLAAGLKQLEAVLAAKRARLTDAQLQGSS